MKNAFTLFITTLFILIVFLPSYKKIQDQKKQIAEYQQQIKDLEKDNRDLVNERRKIEGDPVYLEEVAREKMGVAREGEVIYRIDQQPAKKK
ncbi:MAG: septum formation initiator family protein [Candidatus Omnitrophica bacterium]|nr:septum formation initiator family protein [Candidatus Omnitrophota bacterium]